ncbi:Multiple inositol polyphosphate phosphatase 1 [Pseudolycoriella hygida]|uniref:Multiple inositol polyphosphate phosphatase 1 n=1 Tax=Pseudolycoriella hygida TaxID=35572 RepID=A0A9Q0NDT3_9DIPT|nr:Multiple inositol polyphosphate phosphatase 1 [Pseudolycoriella hygida]
MFRVADFFLLLLAIFSTLADVTLHDPFYCYAEDPIRSWTPLGGIHSPYEPNRGQIINANVSTCEPSKFWLLGRHGARLPLDTEFPNIFGTITTIHRQIITNYNQGRTSLCASDFELLNNWQFNPNITLDIAGHLAHTGWNEVEALAQRYQAAFPSILSSTYSADHFTFRSTNFQRTEFSLRAFADGLFGVNAHEQVRFDDIPEPDIFMRPYQNCPLYTQINAVRVEQDAFLQGPEYQQMTVQVSAKLGFHNSNVLRIGEVAAIALQCKLEQIWDSNFTSPFCAAFSVANAQVIEYSEDVDWYYRIGYGRPEYRQLYENLMCFHIQDMLRFIQSPDVNKARIMSGHVNLFLILMHFDAFDDDLPLTRHNFAQQMQRVWKSSDHLPMAANLAVIQFDCDEGDNDLLFLYNEKPLLVPGCDSNGVCKQSLIFQRFSRYLNANCMEVYCTNE